MWDLLLALLQQQGPTALVVALLAAAIIYLYRQNENKAAEIVILHEKRLSDALSCKDDYEALAKNLDKSIDLLVEVFRSKNGNGGRQSHSEETEKEST